MPLEFLQNEERKATVSNHVRFPALRDHLSSRFATSVTEQGGVVATMRRKQGFKKTKKSTVACAARC